MKQKYLKWLLFTVVLLALLIISALFSLTTGEFSISLKDVFRLLNEKEGMDYFVLSELRIPRVLLGFAVGGGLSLSGVILQGIFRNPLVEPYTLGVSGGAAVGVAFVIIFGLQITLGTFVLPIAGFGGAILALVVVGSLGFLRGGVDINKMLLIGVMISFVASSTLMLLMSMSTKDNLQSIVFWMMGSLEESNRFLIKTVVISSLVGLASSYFFARPLNALMLGEAKAGHLGVDSKVTIRILFLIASLLTGICVAVAGVIGFVGLVIPHFIRLIIGPDHRFLLIGSFLGGGIFLILSDILARTIIAPNELPIGVITGIAGGILFIAVLHQNKKKSSYGK